MTVAVQNGLKNLANSLRRYGFDVVVYGQYPYRIDALVYIGTYISSDSISASLHSSHATFTVNADGKTACEIARILNRRTCSPLF